MNNNKNKSVYLTIDDGPSGNTEAFLEVLRKHNSFATFFLVGENIIGREDVVKRIADERHTIAVHTYTHDYGIIYQSDEAFWEDNLRTRKMLTDIIGYEPWLMRFPGGSSNTISRRFSAGIMSRLTAQTLEHGYEYFDWNISPEDVFNDNNDVEGLVGKVVSGIHEGFPTPVILMHDMERLKNNPRIVDMILSQCIPEGWSFEAILRGTQPVHQKVNN